MTSWLPDLSRHKGSKYQRIADAIGEAIKSGDLKADSKLPPMRNLAYDLGVTLGTVARAYQEAERRGLIGGEVGRGTYVKSDGRYPEPKTPRAFALGGIRDNGINLTMAVPPIGPSGEMLSRTMREIADDIDLCEALTDYQSHSGLVRHREAGVAWVARMDVETDPGCITITNGTQHAVVVALAALARSGDTVLAESLTYPGVIHAAAQLGIKLAPVDIDDEGMIPDALEAAIDKHRPRAVYLVPTIQNPTTGIMSIPRRQRIADILMGHGLLAIEDDIWGFLPRETMPAIKSFAPEQVVYATGLSKAMAPGLRVGYIAAPPGAVDAIRAVARMSSWMTPPLMAEIALRWIEDGSGDELIRWQRQEAAARMAIAADILDGFAMRGQKSYQVWLDLPEPWRADAFRRQAERRGVFFLSGEAFVVGRHQPPHAIRLCVGSCRTRDEVKLGIEVVRDLLENPTGDAAVIA